MPNSETEPEHECDFENPKRLGRAHYVCRECGKDITLALVLLTELEDGTRSS